MALYKLFYISSRLQGLLVYLQALTLVGPTVTRPVLEPLAVLHLNNLLNILIN